MKSYNIAVIGGDGTGPEVIREAVKVLEAAAKKFRLKLNYTDYDLGGARYLRTGEALPDSVLAELRKFPAILLGAIGHPDVKPGILEKGILLRTRFELEQYINLRPVKLYDERFCPLKDKKPEHIDFVGCARLDIHCIVRHPLDIQARQSCPTAISTPATKPRRRNIR